MNDENNVSNNYYYELPPELIAQSPKRPRDEAKMFVLHRDSGRRELKRVKDLPDYLNSGDAVVINNTKVVPTILRGNRESGGQILIRLVSRKSQSTWDCSVDGIRSLLPGELITLADGQLLATVVDKNQQHTGYIMTLSSYDGKEDNIDALIQDKAMYFHPMHLFPLKKGEEDILQTVYAKHNGSFQSPSAGLHMTKELLSRLRSKGVKVVEITQHVGRLDDPKPLSDDADNVDSLYEEWYNVSAQAAEQINNTKKNGGKVIAIGTTVTRTLETCANEDGLVHEGCGWATLYLKPGSKFNIVDGLLSNFQSPKITTLILACAFAGTDHVLRFYNEAVRMKLRFLEYGDAALYI